MPSTAHANATWRFAVPDQNMFQNHENDVTPVPEDDEKIQVYIQDRRVIGVRSMIFPSSLHHVPLGPCQCYNCLSLPSLTSFVPQYDPLVQPALLRHEIRSSPESQRTIASARFSSARILAGRDNRVLVIVGPCSIHSPEQAVEYAKLLKAKIPSWNNLLIIMRAYLNPVRQWAGKVSSMTPTSTVPSILTKVSGLHASSSVTSTTSACLSVPNSLIPSALSTLQTLLAGERLVHGRQRANCTESLPVVSLSLSGSKTVQTVTVAIDAMRSASNPHAFMGVTEQGLAAIVKTRGNQDVHVILRGGTSGTNYDEESVKKAAEQMGKARPGSWPSLMIDCSHGNSQKNHLNQSKVVSSICSQLRAGNRNITGVMIESHIKAGRQDVPAEGPQGLEYGVSITDACVDWETTVKMLDELNEAAGARKHALIEAGLRKPAAFQRVQEP
ncbi:unnamed protein product [Somion occarium]|uniref:3-deoxy-7-phosphoheptulonate synthase n=1 Tax=Somion occarium TaxID=3059160 RepID=A0ABP1CQP5_9APHY